MAERVLDRVIAIADRLREQAAEAERLGRLPDETVKDLKSVGVIRLLQPKQYNGFEVHPREFAETVMAVASLDPASGWICGVVGVHPYQLAYADPRVPEEIWGADTDTWVASPYAPQGVATPVEDLLAAMDDEAFQPCGIARKGMGFVKNARDKNSGHDPHP